MSILCNVCDREILEDENQLKEYIATHRKRIDRCLYIDYTINNIDLDGFDKLLNEYISCHNKKFRSYFFKLTCEIQFNNNFIQTLETNYHSNSELNNMKSYLLSFIDSFTSRGYEFCKINHITINTMNYRCDIIYGYYMKQPMHFLERRFNMLIAKNPHLRNSLDRSHGLCLITRYSHIHE